MAKEKKLQILMAKEQKEQKKANAKKAAAKKKVADTAEQTEDTAEK